MYVDRAIRALIVDDEPLGREAIRSLLSRDPQVTRILEAANGREAVGFLEARDADVMFLDVQMPDMDGVSLLGEIDPQWLPAIVFVTAHERYAVEAFNRNAVDYLLKPVGAERFARALEKAKSHLRARALKADVDSAVAPNPSSSAAREPLRQIAVRWQQKIVLIPIETIGWIRAADDYVELHAGGRRYLLHATLNKLEAKLDPKSFLRVHRSVIVNLTAIKEITPGAQGEFDIVIRDGTPLRSGRTYGEVIRQLLSNSL
jgi:two-component system, LytTR family, response regulator